MAVLVGSATTFKCHNDSSRFCWTYKANMSKPIAADICRSGHDDNFIDRCSVTNRNDGTYALAVRDVQLSDAGFYICGDCIKGKATAHLQVLGKT